MQILAVIRRRVEAFPEERFDELLGPEAEAVRRLYAQDAVRAVYSRGDTPGAVLLIEATGLESAWEMIGSLPFAQRDMIEVEQLVPLRPYRGFAPSAT